MHNFKPILSLNEVVKKNNSAILIKNDFFLTRRNEKELIVLCLNVLLLNTNLACESAFLQLRVGLGVRFGECANANVQFLIYLTIILIN